jgi:hypothetical protein
MNNDDFIKFVGVLARWGFFAAAFIAWCVWADSATWPGFTTPFGELTVRLLAGSVMQLVLMVGCILGLRVWAFHSGKKNYDSWGYAASFVALIAYFAYRWMDSK